VNGPDGKKFVWGKIVQIHEVGHYQIVEHRAPSRSANFTLLFHVYVDGRDASRAGKSLDEALALAIAYRHEGSNGRAGEYFMKMLREDR
jgi:hypothetical protein